MSTAPPVSTMHAATLRALLADCGVPAFRAVQLRNAVWQPFVESLDDIRQLPPALRESLGAQLRFSTVRVLSETEADLGNTVKLLCDVGDGLSVETVAMETPRLGRSRRRGTVCVSSQVGCAVGCPFCATGRMGLRRNCSAAEIVDQVRAAGAALHRRGLGPVTHVVYMGMGEPLANAPATIESLRVLTADGGISPRRVTVSTSGVVQGIRQLLAEAPPVTLAISLHAATDELRNRLVPINRTQGIEVLLEAGIDYASRTARRLTFEWCLIGGVNDSLEQADALRRLALRASAHVNVIPMNRIEGSAWGPPTPETARAFLHRLRDMTVTVRDTRGGDADAACGQLRAALEARRELRPDGTLGPSRAAQPA